MSVAVGQLLWLCSICLLTPDSRLKERALFRTSKKRAGRSSLCLLKFLLRYFCVLCSLTLLWLKLVLWPSPKSMSQWSSTSFRRALHTTCPYMRQNEVFTRKRREQKFSSKSKIDQQEIWEPISKRGQRPRKLANCNHGQGWKMEAVWVQLSKWILNPTASSWVISQPLPDFYITSSISWFWGPKPWPHPWAPIASGWERRGLLQL